MTRVARESGDRGKVTDESRCRQPLLTMMTIRRDLWKDTCPECRVEPGKNAGQKRDPGPGHG